MKLILVLLALSIVGGNYTPPVQKSLLPENTIYVDAINAKFDLIFNMYDNPREGPDVDFLGTDSTLNILGQLPDLDVYASDGNYRSIISFDAPQMKIIDRLTLRIKHTMYKKWDVLHWFPQVFTDSYVVNAGGFYRPYGATWFQNVTGQSMTGQYVCPNIGKPQDLIDLEQAYAALPGVTTGIYKGIWDSKYSQFIDNPSRGSRYTIPISESNIVDRSFYVILPMSYTEMETWISVAGTDINDVVIHDGLDIDGNPLITTISGSEYKYIDFGTDSPRSVYFTHRSVIRQVRLISGSTDSSRILSFGDYNFEDSEFTLKLRDYDLGSIPNYLNQELVVLPGYDAVLVKNASIACVVRIVYESLGAAVYQNIVDENGVENPITVDPYNNTDFDWGVFIPDFTGLDSFLEVLRLIFQIVLFALGIGLVVWFVILIIPSARKSIQYKKSKSYSKRGKKK